MAPAGSWCRMKHVTTLVNLLRRSVCRCWPRDPGLSKLRSLALLRRIRRMRRQLGEGRGVVRDLASILARLRGWIETLELRLWRWRGASAIGGRFLRKRVGHYNCNVLVNDCHRIGTERGLAQLVVIECHYSSSLDSWLWPGAERSHPRLLGNSIKVFGDSKHCCLRYWIIESLGDQPRARVRPPAQRSCRRARTPIHDVKQRSLLRSRGALWRAGSSVTLAPALEPRGRS
jgi:hypothetical protein